LKKCRLFISCIDPRHRCQTKSVLFGRVAKTQWLQKSCLLRILGQGQADLWYCKSLLLSARMVTLLWFLDLRWSGHTQVQFLGPFGLGCKLWRAYPQGERWQAPPLWDSLCWRGSNSRTSSLGPFALLEDLVRDATQATCHLRIRFFCLKQ